MWGIAHLLTDPNAGETFRQDALTIVFWIVSIAGALLTVYAVYIGYLFATATDAAKRTAAKKRLMTIFSSALCIYALAACLKVIEVKFDPVKGNPTQSGGQQSNNNNNVEVGDFVFSNFEYISLFSNGITTNSFYNYTFFPESLKFKDGTEVKEDIKIIGFCFAADTGMYKQYDDSERSTLTLQEMRDDGSLEFTYRSDYYGGSTIKTRTRLRRNGKEDHFVAGTLSIKYGDSVYRTVEVWIPIFALDPLFGGPSYTLESEGSLDEVLG